MRKFRKNVKAISPVLSVLMMITVAVAASLVTYAWVMGYLGFTTAKAGKAVMIQSIGNGTTTLLVYVQNVGDGTTEFDPEGCAYVDGELRVLGSAIRVDSVTTNIVQEGKTATLNVTISDDSVDPGDTFKVRIVTLDGTFTEATESFG